MRVAALYDVHANIPALDAVLDEVQQAGVEAIVVGGDVLPGPMPRETLARLLDLRFPVHCIYGNGEIAVLEEMAGNEPVAVPEAYRPIIRWTAQQLDTDHQRLLSTWPKTLRLYIQGLGEVLFCHATPQSENEIFTQRMPEENLLPVLSKLKCPLFIASEMSGFAFPSALTEGARRATEVSAETRRQPTLPSSLRRVLFAA